MTAGEPLVIGLLAGVAAGKSTVAGMFAEAGVEVLDADEMARTVVAQPEVLDRIRDRFGSEVMVGDGPDQRLDREALGKKAFANQQARRDLEEITHPAIRAELVARMHAAKKAGRTVLLDVPLLLEGGLIDSCDICVFVAASEAQRSARARARGWPEGERALRESHQAPLLEKRARSRYVINNDGTVQDTKAQVQKLLVELGLAAKNGKQQP